MAVKAGFCNFAPENQQDKRASVVWIATIFQCKQGLPIWRSEAIWQLRICGCVRLVKQIMMKRIIMKVVVAFALLVPTVVLASSKANDSSFDWTPVIEAIIEVESEGNANARSGSSCGAMQITPVMVRECNIILKRRKSKRRFMLSDRFSVAKSKEMFILFQSYHNPSNDIEKAIRSWNGGPRYSMRRTQSYYEKVKRAMK